MAQVFAGKLPRVDQDLLPTLHALPDNYWVFLEFTLLRQVDILLLRTGSPTSTLTLTELKRSCQPLRGLTDGPWQRRTPAGTWEPVVPRHHDDVNYYDQAVNTADALSRWLHTHQRLYRHTLALAPERAFKVWPTLLILGGAAHQLPAQPTSNYGRWFVEEQRWWTHVEGRLGQGIALDGQEVAAMAEVLGLTRLAPPQTGARAGVGEHQPVRPASASRLPLPVRVLTARA